MLTSSRLDCFFLVSDNGLDTADIASCRRGEPWWWWCESVAPGGKWKVPDCERGTGIRDIYNKQVDVGCWTKLFVRVCAHKSLLLSDASRLSQAVGQVDPSR